MLRLLLRGHDGKSAAQVLGISLTAVHERLREARRKLGVGSSREAARLLAAVEGDPEFHVDEDFGLHRGPEPVSPALAAQRRAGLFALGGLVMIGIVVGALMLWSTGSGDLEGAGPAAAPAAAPPRVVRTTPAQGAEIAPGPFTLTVTYDQPMQRNNYSFVRISPETFPDCGSEVTQLPDGRSFAMHCTARPGHRYEVWFNSPPYLNFKAKNGPAAPPYQLLFRAKGE